MTFLVLPALIPDIRAVYDAYFAAFTADADGRVLLDILFPDTDFSSPAFRDAHAKGTLAWWHGCDTQHTFKCVDSKTGEVVGMALCDVFSRERTEEERKMPELGWLEGEKRVRAERVLRPLWEAREAVWGGGRYIYVHAFAVVPKHQGRGAGAALVRALTDLGDSTGLPVYLESSAGAHGLYKKMGFSQVPAETAGVVHKAEVLGTDKDIDVPLMMRLPKTKTKEEEGKSVEEIYLEWYARRGSAVEGVDGAKGATA